MKAAILAASKADAIPEGSSGLWHVKKYGLSKEITAPSSRGPRQIPPGRYTCLMCYTEATMHLIGEMVMHDVPYELLKHLQFMLQAHGRVLITGLGLGCVTRGVLANPAVTAVTVIEKEQDVLNLVRPHMPQDKRLTIVQADALQWVKEYDGDPFDCAWHDLWIDEQKEDATNLQVLHMQLICDLADKVPMQGAWEFPRMFRRSMDFAGVI